MLKSQLKKMIPKEQWDKYRTHKRNLYARFQKSQLNPELKSEPKILILGVADYENLGDHAIAYAQRALVDTISSDYKVYEIPSRTPVTHIHQIINKKDILIFTGGGNLGTTYEFMNDIFLPIIKHHPHNQKLFMPQSYTFSDNDSDKLMNTIKSVFAKVGKTLTITARESKSLKLFQQTFPENNIISTPDIVLSLDKIIEDEDERAGILMFMRGEGEKVLDMATQDLLVEKLRRTHTVTYPKTDYTFDVTPEMRLPVLDERWDTIRKSQLLITDRLHGMIFAQITGTPCIVFDNHNSKIKMTCQDWLPDMESIVFVDPRQKIVVSDFIELAHQTMQKEPKPFDVATKYTPLIEQLQAMMQK